MKTPVYIAKQYFNKLDEYEGKMIKGDNFKIFDTDIDIYTEKKELLCKFRKKILTDNECITLYNFKNVAKMGINCCSFLQIFIVKKRIFKFFNLKR
jgi:hypothetical protein